MDRNTLAILAAAFILLTMPALAWDDEDDDGDPPALRQVQPLLHLIPASGGR